MQHLAALLGILVTAVYYLSWYEYSNLIERYVFSIASFE